MQKLITLLNLNILESKKLLMILIKYVDDLKKKHSMI